MVNVNSFYTISTVCCAALWRYATTWLVWCVLICTGIPAHVWAQREAEHWYFGDSLSVSFATGVPVVGRGNLKTEEGCAAVSNPATGAPMLYTDGQKVWSGNGNILENGTDLLGHISSAQSALLVPQPGNAGFFFLFTAGAGPYEIPDNNGIRYSFIDAVQGKVTAKNIDLLEPASEKLVAIQHCNGTDVWVVAQEWGTNHYYAWQVSASGVMLQPVVSTTGTIAPMDNAAYTIGCLKASPNGKRIVNTGYYDDAVQLFDFDNVRGVLSNPITLPHSDAVYCTSFSPDNSKLYVVEQRLGSSETLIRIYQYTVLGTAATIVASRTLVFEMKGHLGDEIGTLQIAPDGKIYCAREAGLYLGVITNPNAAGTACGYVHNGLYLNGRRCVLGLPNFNDGLFNTGASCSPPQAVFNIDTTICAGMCVDIEDKSLHQPASWHWEFPGGTPTTATVQNPVVCYYQPGVYDVRLIVSNPKGSDTLTRKGAVRVQPRLGARAGEDMVVCKGKSIVLQGSGGELYSWAPAGSVTNPTSATTTAQPDTTTSYILTVRSGTCVDYDTVTVVVAPLPEVRGGEYALCAGDSVRHVALGSTGHYRWFPVQGVSNPDTSAPMLFPTETTEYRVTVTDANGCESTATVRVLIGDAVVDAGRDTTVCAGSAVQLFARGIAGAYKWTPVDGLDDPHSTTPKAAPMATTTYTVTVTTASGCSATDSIVVVVYPRPQVEAGEDVAICKNGVVRLVATGTAGTYSWSPVEGVETPNDSATVVRPAQTTLYTVIVSDANGCTAGDSVWVVVDESIEIDAGDNKTLCAGDSVQLSAWAGEGTYQWTPAEGLDNPTSPRPSAKPSHTTVYTVEVITSSGCIGKDSVAITVLPVPMVQAEGAARICRGQRTPLRATGEGTIVGWTPVESVDNPLSWTPSVAPDTTTVYTVSVRGANGCIATDTVRIEVEHAQVRIAAGDTTVCTGEAIAIAAVGGKGVYRWEPAAIVENPDSMIAVVRAVETVVLRVVYTNDYGCTAADSILLRVDGARAVLSLPDTTAKPGAHGVHFPLVLRAESGSVIPPVLSARFEIHYNALLLNVTGVSRGAITSNIISSTKAPSVVVVDVPPTALPGSSGILTELIGTVLLSATDTTVLALHNVQLTTATTCIAARVQHGRLRLDGYCFGNDFRRFEQPRVVIAPHPVQEQLALSIHFPQEQCTVVMELHSVWGKCVVRDKRIVKKENAQLLYDVSSLARGTYYLSIEIDGWRMVQPLLVAE